ncbi:two-component system chemotaxis response regulator CheB [Polaromonas sp. CG_9.5]|uniref:chemotaxis protein CheB n=1 Tax=Polaromonas sp. CG_9.5 TaxID=3071705 RepID=UPI002E075754|nr:two-component system chemotaxis response regulator CheB [Polaromonas sp. CG_9.5]
MNSSFRAPRRPIEAVVIGASAGGVDALMTILPGLSPTFGLPIVVVLHLPEGRPSLLAHIFGLRLSIPVREAADKESIAPSTVYFAPPGYHLSVEADRSFSLSCEAPVHFSRPSIDLLLESAADAYGAALAGILLTGANFDGAAGLAKIKECGGFTVVQNPAQAQVATMPEAALRQHTPDLILDLEDIRSLLPQLEKLHHVQR